MAASPHDCSNPSRSDQGNAKAGANSQSWLRRLDNDGNGIDLVFSAHRDETMGACMACGVDFG